MSKVSLNLLKNVMNQIQIPCLAPGQMIYWLTSLIGDLGQINGGQIALQEAFQYLGIAEVISFILQSARAFLSSPIVRLPWWLSVQFTLTSCGCGQRFSFHDKKAYHFTASTVSHFDLLCNKTRHDHKSNLSSLTLSRENCNLVIPITATDFLLYLTSSASDNILR